MRKACLALFLFQEELTSARMVLRKVMRREIEFNIRRDDGTKCEIRVNPFSGRFKFRFKEAGAEKWDYERKPNREELEMFLDILQRRYQRRRSAHEDVVEAERMLKDYLHEHGEGEAGSGSASGKGLEQ
jgi:hypothetical protein